MMQSSRARFKQALRQCKPEKSKHVSDSLATKLLHHDSSNASAPVSLHQELQHDSYERFNSNDIADTPSSSPNLKDSVSKVHKADNHVD